MELDALTTLPALCGHDIIRRLDLSDKAALRLASRDARRLCNSNVRSVQLAGVHIYAARPVAQPITLARLRADYPRLDSLALADSDGPHRITGELLASFLDTDGGKFNCQRLDIKRCHYLSPAEQSALLLACGAALQELRLSRWAGSAHLLHLLLLAGLPHLVSLDLGDPDVDVVSVTDGALGCLPCMPSLTALSLQRCVGVTDAGVACLTSRRLPHLASLDLSHTSITGVSGFADASSTLSSLVLRGCRALREGGLAAVCSAVRSGGGDDGGDTGDRANLSGSIGGGRACSSSGRLRELYLCGSGVQPHGRSLWHLASPTCAHVEVLDLGPSWELDAQGLEALARCSALRDLRIGNLNIRGGALGAAGPLQAGGSDPAAPTRSPLPRLERLSLGGMFASHGAALLLPLLPSLQRLELTGLHTARDELVALLLPEAGRSGAGALPGLQELRLVGGGPDLSAALLLRLAELPALRRLELAACPNASEAVIAKLLTAVRAAGRRLEVEVVARLPSGGGGSGSGGYSAGTRCSTTVGARNGAPQQAVGTAVRVA